MIRRLALAAAALTAAAVLTGCQPTSTDGPCNEIPADPAWDYSNGYVYETPADAKPLGYQLPPFGPDTASVDAGRIYPTPGAFWTCHTVSEAG